MNADRGYDPANLLTARISMPENFFAPLRRIEILELTLSRIKSLPGATYGAIARSIPLGQGYSLSAFTMRRRDGTTATGRAIQRYASHDYFAALRIKLLQGRLFQDH